MTLEIEMDSSWTIGKMHKPIQSNLTKVPCKFLKVCAQIQGRVEVAKKEPGENPFLAREMEDARMLQYPERTDRQYEGKHQITNLS